MSATSVALPAASSLNLIQSGTVLLAVHGALFGYYCSECSIYFVRFQTDRIGFRVLVWWMLAIEIAYIIVKVGGFVTMINIVLGGNELHIDTLWLNFTPVLLTVLMEGSAEGFFCWRLCAVSTKLWMKVIAVGLWCFSTGSHIIWVAMLGQIDGRTSGNPPRLRILLMMSFWGTAAENIWISSCLIYELAFSRDRKALKKGGQPSASITKLLSLAMRTSAILIVFELLVAILVSVGGQNPVALGIETSFATTIYTVLCATVVMHTLNYRTQIRNASPTFSSPIFFAPQHHRSSTTTKSKSTTTDNTNTTTSDTIGSGESPPHGGGGFGGGGRRLSRGISIGPMGEERRRGTTNTMGEIDRIGSLTSVPAITSSSNGETLSEALEGEARRDREGGNGGGGGGFSRWTGRNPISTNFLSSSTSSNNNHNDDQRVNVEGSKKKNRKEEKEKKDKKKKPKKMGTNNREMVETSFGGNSGIGITVLQTVSYVENDVNDEEGGGGGDGGVRNLEGGGGGITSRENGEMVVERGAAVGGQGRKDAPTKDLFERLNEPTKS